jgi:NAD(P)-dependent dehydrogenase (short-subunit alcohol dehydrogenase family)
MVALVTGAAVGIGRAIALALLAEGMDTWLADVQDPAGPEGRFVRVDVTDIAALHRLIVEAKPDGARELRRARVDRHAPRATGGGGDDRRRARSGGSDGRNGDDHRGRRRPPR